MAGDAVSSIIDAEHYDTKIGYDLGNDSSVIFNYQKYKSDYTRPDTGSNDKAADKGKKNDDSLSIQYKAQINERLSNQFSLYRNRTTFKDNYTFSGSGSYRTFWDMGMKTTGVSDQLTWKLANQTVIGGFDWYKDEITHYHNIYPSSDIYPSGATVKEVPDGTHISNTAFYVQDKIDITGQWNVTPGIRVDHHSQFGNRTSPSLSVGYMPNDKTNYYFNYKTFFVAPDMYQMYVWNSLAHGNRDLKPETGYTFEFGVNHKFDDTLSGTLNIFHTYAHNMIKYYNLYPDPGIYKNADRANINGFNLNLNKEFSRHWSTYVGYTYMHMNAQEGENINNDGAIPESTLNVGVNYKADKFSASLDGRGVMNRYGKKTHPEMRNYANYWVWDMAANYHFTKGAVLFARVNNILTSSIQTLVHRLIPTGLIPTAPGTPHRAAILKWACSLPSDGAAKIPQPGWGIFCIQISYVFWMKWVGIQGSCRGWGTPAFFPASRHFRIQAVCRARVRMVCRPSLSFRASSLVRP